MTENPENPPQNLIQERTKRDPAIGASVRLAAIHDSMGFLTFPGPALPLP
jgi:Mg/Co/Ni transporter MgtE